MNRPRHLCILLMLATLSCGVRAEGLKAATEAMGRKDWPTAVRLLEPLAERGDAQAQARLGLLYYHGHGVRESDAEALRWFERAARQGHADAQYHLGNLYAYGLAPLPAEADGGRLAAQWYFEAARQEHADAQYALGILFLTGTGVQQSAAEAERWIGKAAAQGHADAKQYLAGRR